MYDATGHRVREERPRMSSLERARRAMKRARFTDDVHAVSRGAPPANKLPPLKRKGHGSARKGGAGPPPPAAVLRAPFNGGSAGRLRPSPSSAITLELVDSEAEYRAKAGLPPRPSPHRPLARLSAATDMGPGLGVTGATAATRPGARAVPRPIGAAAAAVDDFDFDDGKFVRPRVKLKRKGKGKGRQRPAASPIWGATGVFDTASALGPPSTGVGGASLPEPDIEPSAARALLMEEEGAAVAGRGQAGLGRGKPAPVMRDTQELLAHVAVLERREAARLGGAAGPGGGGEAKPRRQADGRDRGRNRGVRGRGDAPDDDAALAAALGDRMRRLHGKLAAAQTLTQQYRGVGDDYYDVDIDADIDDAL